MSLSTPEYSGKFDSHTDNILFFCDPSLGEQGYRVFSGFFPNSTQLIWEKGADKTPLHRELRAQSWLFTVSFYNDFIFSRDDFNFLGLPLNVHPALPALRGVGHDHIPLIEDHEEHGGTLHYMRQPLSDVINITNEIDTGKIIRTKKRMLSANATFSDLRHLNQQVVLKMLAELCKQMLEWGCINIAHRELSRESTMNGHVWGNRYIDKRTLRRKLEEVKASTCNHRAFK